MTDDRSKVRELIKTSGEKLKAIIKERRIIPPEFGESEKETVWKDTRKEKEVVQSVVLFYLGPINRLILN